MIIKALRNISLNDFLGSGFFSSPEIDSRDSILGEELVVDEEALNQWRRTMDTLNHRGLSPNH